MLLWNDYEGQTIAEAYPLKKLLRPEGRSAFFLTSTKDGKSEIIRLTESLNDEHEVLERLRHVSEVHQPNLVIINGFGETTFDGVHLTYALMEPSDSSLSEILRERPLTPTETTEVALSLAAALKALHEIDMIHAHVEPANVVACGEVVKLRSDCVRECIPDPEFNPPAACLAARQGDVHDLGVLLLQCLTLEKTLRAGTRLPVPFDQIIPKTIDGAWGLAEITRILAPQAVKPLVPQDVLAAGSSKPTATSANDPAEVARALPQTSGFAHPVKPADAAKQDTPQKQAGTAQPARPIELKTVAGPKVAPAAKSAAAQTALPLAEPELHTVRPVLKLRRFETETTTPFRFDRRWVPIGAAAIFLLLCIWMLTRTKSHTPAPAVASAATPAAIPTPEPPATTAAVPVPAQPAPAAAEPTATQPGWHVVAYTFNRADQAWTRIRALQREHASLNPRLFTPTGHAPYFVALGGVMSQGEAEAVRERARRAGLPRDTFARFYHGQQ